MTKHGHASPQTPEYKAWYHMKGRCLNPTDKSYHNYGGRGIRVCIEWQNSFSAFLKDVGLRPSPKHTIERIDNNGHYEPSNITWATQREQGNNRRTNVFIEYNGHRLTLADWARKLRVQRLTLWNRLFILNWPVDRALTPYDHRFKQSHYTTYPPL